MKYQTYIFDLDGTLLDTLGDLAASVNYALRTHGMPEHSIDDVRRFVGNGVRKLMERAVPQGAGNPAFNETFDAFREHYMQHSLDTTRPYDGVSETLAALKARGCRLAVVSNKMMAATQELCHHFFPDTIEVAIGENEAQGIRKSLFSSVVSVKSHSRNTGTLHDLTNGYFVKRSISHELHKSST